MLLNVLEGCVERSRCFIFENKSWTLRSSFAKTSVILEIEILPSKLVVSHKGTNVAN